MRHRVAAREYGHGVLRLLFQVVGAEGPDLAASDDAKRWLCCSQSSAVQSDVGSRVQVQRASREMKTPRGGGERGVPTG